MRMMRGGGQDDEDEEGMATRTDGDRMEYGRIRMEREG